MQFSDVLFIIMGASLAAIIAVLIYAVSKKIKIDGEGNRHLLITVIIFTLTLMASGATYVLMTTN